MDGDWIARDRVVAVVGTGTMGRGIAQVALSAGHPVVLHDAEPGRAEEAAAAIGGRLDRQVDKGRITAEERDAARARLRAAGALAGLAPAALVVEAVVEDLAVKRRLFTDLEAVVADDCLLATNTSSLPVTAVAAPLRLPGRFLGLHFFNPAPLLPLVEVVSGAATDPAVAAFARATALAWGKSPVSCTDSPGFIVNRVARPFYAEGFRVHEERVADPATVDAVLRESGGFAMGPFELTDLIGHDVNEAVTRSVWTAFHFDPRFAPSPAQRQLVDAGRLGRKSGHGWYAYEGEGHTRDGGGVSAPPTAPSTAPPAKAPERVTVHGELGPAVALVGLVEEAGIPVERTAGGPGRGWIELPGGTGLALTDGRPATREGVDVREGSDARVGTYTPEALFDLALDYRTATRVAVTASETAPPAALEAATGLFQALGKQVSVIGDVPGMVVARTVAMLVDFAADAVARGVAAPDDVDTAMRLGVNYPVGPLEWGDRLGARWVTRVLDALHLAYPTGRYAPSPPLRRRAVSGRSLLRPDDCRTTRRN